MFRLGTPLWNITLRSLLVYVAVYAGLRLMGKRQLGQMTVFDLVVILLIANAVQNAMVGPDFSVEGGIVAALVLLLVNFLVSRIRLLHGSWGRILEGSPTLLVRDGRYLEKNLAHEGLEEAEVAMAIREHGLDSVREVRLAYLETDGSISVVPMVLPALRSRRRVRQLRKR